MKEWGYYANKLLSRKLWVAILSSQGIDWNAMANTAGVPGLANAEWYIIVAYILSQAVEDAVKRFRGV